LTAKDLGESAHRLWFAGFQIARAYDVDADDRLLERRQFGIAPDPIPKL
jgi:hypothetical protein